MPSKSLLANQPEPSSGNVPPSTAGCVQLLQAVGYISFALGDVGENAPKESLLDQTPVMEESKNDQSPSNDGDDDDETSKDSETAGSSSTHPDGSSEQQLRKSQYADSSLSLATVESFSHQPHLELVGHSIACASSPYPDMYYGGMMSAYGPQALIPPPPFYGMHQPRMPLPLEMAPETVYVNAKQYHGILRRRQVRAKAELERKLIKARKPYLHESRHQHALRRARGSGGRFAKKSEAEAANHSADEGHKASDMGRSLSLSAKKETSNVYRGKHSGKGQSNQQWGGMSSDHAPQCTLAI